MVHFQEFSLANGLKVVVHEDPTVSTVVVNVCYNVGSRNEDPELTGFAHLFEHLMFGGSVNIPSYDTPLQQAGAENNAFTSPDITNYYVTIPVQNAETAFWLESDRMLGLSFDPEVLEVQRKVVIEEFKQRYLNQPYGDVWLKLRPLTYKVHPYQWATIGKSIEHIENATMDQVKAFFKKYYLPNNAVLVVAGNISLEMAKELSIKYFEGIPAGPLPTKHWQKEPVQTAPRRLLHKANVPSNQILVAYHMPARHSEGYAAADLLSDILGRGKSSFLYKKLVVESTVFSSISAYVLGSLDAGLLMVSGQVATDVDALLAEKALFETIAELATNGSDQATLDMVKVKAETSTIFGQVELLNRAMGLAMAANAGNTHYINTEWASYEAVNIEEVNAMAKEILRVENSSTLLYLSEKSEEIHAEV
jgi:zinc protease